MAARDQHSAGHQHTVARIQTGHGLAQIQPNALRDTRRDQQLDSRLQAKEPFSVGPHRRRQLIEVRSVSRVPSAVLTIRSCCRSLAE